MWREKPEIPWALVPCFGLNWPLFCRNFGKGETNAINDPNSDRWKFELGYSHFISPILSNLITLHVSTAPSNNVPLNLQTPFSLVTYKLIIPLSYYYSCFDNSSNNDRYTINVINFNKY